MQQQACAGEMLGVCVDCGHMQVAMTGLVLQRLRQAGGWSQVGHIWAEVSDDRYIHFIYLTHNHYFVSHCLATI